MLMSIAAWSAVSYEIVQAALQYAPRFEAVSYALINSRLKNKVTRLKLFCQLFEENERQKHFNFRLLG